MYLRSAQHDSYTWYARIDRCDCLGFFERDAAHNEDDDILRFVLRRLCWLEEWVRVGIQSTFDELRESCRQERQMLRIDVLDTFEIFEQRLLETVDDAARAIRIM